MYKPGDDLALVLWKDGGSLRLLGVEKELGLSAAVLDGVELSLEIVPKNESHVNNNHKQSNPSNLRCRSCKLNTGTYTRQ